MSFVNLWIEGMQGIFDKFIGYVSEYMPKSPFINITADNSKIYTYMCYLNWFVPFNLLIDTFNLILVALVTYYLISILLRWLKILG